MVFWPAGRDRGAGSAGTAKVTLYRGLALVSPQLTQREPWERYIVPKRGPLR